MPRWDTDDLAAECTPTSFTVLIIGLLYALAAIFAFV